ncbi:peptidase C1A family protein [Dictyostelium discoideum AX4]|uniref:Cathepsin B n=1 Tax=Dictyostelium discoideum TaxID=44689 RepID=CTSB_DICDI|nr:peptidase C1A family protein [Dictyostelium discoideum AX4]Q54QD9.1 RecName: Full=Cathepsin B; AltName: Full=Cathepsin B1; Flags: Precursor [Dictyostelium discoideum]EAL65448.1 peptidase C1A family protein [Dictyostelium discoideum AX4]|eukprot:XP_638805.1 peptidase C1A family protein [Dictyostelium discoideum AX4]
MRVLLSLVVILFIINSAFAVKINIGRPTKSHKTIHHETWVEEQTDQFDNIKVGQLLGFKRSPNRPKLQIKSYDPLGVQIPTSFNAQTNWPNCTTISQIQNQARCGSCWAFGATESATDRLCIHNNENVQLSFMDMVTCDETDNGCEGGDAFSAWNWLRKQGAVSEECLPYTIPTCPPAQQPCLNFVNTPSCTKECQSNSSLIYSQDKHKMAKIYSFDSDEAIMQEIVTNGPVEACFTVFEDFLAYKSGVYVHTTGKDLGGHCVKLVGFGTLNGVDYYAANNQWTTSWGDNGTFLIKRGDCGISDDVVAGLP